MENPQLPSPKEPPGRTRAVSSGECCLQTEPRWASLPVEQGVFDIVESNALARISHHADTVVVLTINDAG